MSVFFWKLEEEPAKEEEEMPSVDFVCLADGIRSIARWKTLFKICTWQDLPGDKGEGMVIRSVLLKEC